MQSGKVLIVDDSAAVRAAVRTVLEAKGLDVVAEAGDGLEAIKLIEELKPDLVLLDLVLPGMSGVDVLTRMGSISPGTKVVVLTALDTDRFAAQALEAGAADFLGKPFDGEELVSVILKTLAAG